jgi:uncharacterized repeat protein (TIGR01451 family)
MGGRAGTVFLATIAAALPGPPAPARAEAPLAPPPNDFCSAPQLLALGQPLAGTTVEAKNDYQLSGGGCYGGVGQTPSAAAGRDVVYRFQTPAAGAYSFRVTGYAAGANVVLYVAGSCPTTGTPPLTVTSCLAAANRDLSGTAEEVSCLSLAAGQTVFVYVDEHAASAGSAFTVEAARCEREAEPNDTPAAAGARACPATGAISPAGDADFFGLGMPLSGSRVFALVDGVAANSSDFDLRVTTTADTREYDDADNDSFFGPPAPNVEGTIATGTDLYLRVSHHSTTLAAEPYRLYAAIQPGSGSAALEAEPNDTLAAANVAASHYHRGSFGSTSDVDLFRFTANAGELIVIGLDADPLRDATPVNAALSLLDASGATLVAVNDPNAASSTTPGTGSLTATTPHSPGEALTWRARTSGNYYARVSGPPPGDYLLSVAIDCRVFPAADLALTKTARQPCAATGQPLTYDLKVDNLGTVTARNVVLRDPLPASVSFVSATPSQGSCKGGATVVCTLGDLNGGANATVVIVVTSNTSGAFTNAASVTADTADGNAANDTAAVTTNGPCSDGDPCTTGDACAGGACVGTPLDCSDTNPCTDDTCSTGECVHANNAAPCEDGNPCSSGDRCAGGACAGGACHGTCATAGKECTQDLYGACVCVDGATACGGPGPWCDGECPPSSLCRLEPSSNTCQCQPLPDCGAAQGPSCAGTCPTGTHCEAYASAAGPDCTCEPDRPACERSTAPACGGACETGYTCADVAGNCRCVAAFPACGMAAAPRCAGSCGPGLACRPAVDGPCVCAPLDLPCGEAAAPACDGRCADGEECVASGTSGCVCQPAPCSESTAPECGGECPAGQRCSFDASSNECFCEVDAPEPCSGSAAPVCGGYCPAGLVCTTDPGGTACRCEPEAVPCVASGYPACGGDCPGDEACTAGTGSCFCAPPLLDCGEQTAPACGGNCPEGLRCTADIGDGGCSCLAPPIACGEADAPLCAGDCPPGTQCLPSGAGCGCASCLAAPPSAAITILFTDGIHFAWNALACATMYDVYRRTGGPFPDTNHDGVADAYGGCLYENVLTAWALDTTTPPPGQLHSYLVSGENAAGEGPLGYASNGLLRPNLAPCP